MQSRDEIEPILNHQLKNPENTEKEQARSAISKFILLEKARNDKQKQLDQIIATQKTGSLPLQDDFNAKKHILETRQQELCGNYFKDPNGLLDQAWSKYVQAEANSSTDANSLLEAFTKLDEERKQIDAQLFKINQHLMISPSPERSFEKLTEVAISKEIKTLTELKTHETDLSGIDWRKTASTASAIMATFLAAGFDFMI